VLFLGIAAVIRDNEKKERREVVEIIKNQIKIEGELVAQYKNFGARAGGVVI
jgi:hypothetical protein